MNQLYHGPWNSRGSFVMILWGFGSAEESRNFKAFWHIMYHFVSVLPQLTTPKKLFRKKFSQILWYLRQRGVLCKRLEKSTHPPASTLSQSQGNCIKEYQKGKNFKVTQHFCSPGSWDQDRTPFAHNVAKLYLSTFWGTLDILSYFCCHHTAQNRRSIIRKYNNSVLSSPPFLTTSRTTSRTILVIFQKRNVTRPVSF